ncbi:MAG: pyridoxal-dependent decarboxylase, partial [Bacteroidota bacterium]
DGALGGTVVLSRKYRHLVKGAEYSDSFTWNAHKMMGVPLTASAILFNKDPQMLRRHFSEKADYLFQGEDDFNPGEYSLQCGRRNDGLKIWAAWKYLGDEGYEARVNQQYELTQYAVKYIQADQDLHLLQEPECITVCFEVANASSQEICNRLNQEGRIKVGYGKVKNKRYIRLVCVDAEMQTQDIDHFFEEVKLVANTLTN